MHHRRDITYLSNVSPIHDPTQCFNWPPSSNICSQSHASLSLLNSLINSLMWEFHCIFSGHTLSLRPVLACLLGLLITVTNIKHVPHLSLTQTILFKFCLWPRLKCLYVFTLVYWGQSMPSRRFKIFQNTTILWIEGV